MPQRETVRVRHTEQTDRLRSGSGTAPDEVDVEGCIVWPAASREEGKGWIQISGYDFLAPAGSDIRATDEVQVRGDWYHVEGVPGDFGRKGLMVNVRRLV